MQVRHDVRLLLRASYYRYRLVDVEQYFAQTQKQMQLVALLIQLEFKLALYAAHPELYPFEKYVVHAEHDRLFVDYYIEIAREGIL